jgi:hypothetical protein
VLNHIGAFQPRCTVCPAPGRFAWHVMHGLAALHDQLDSSGPRSLLWVCH